MNRYLPIVPLAILGALFALFMVVRLGPASVLLIEPLVGFGLGYLAAMYLGRRTFFENQRLRAEVEALEAQNRELRATVDRFLEENDA